LRIIIGNGVGALWLSTEKEWARREFCAAISDISSAVRGGQKAFS